MENTITLRHACVAYLAAVTAAAACGTLTFGIQAGILVAREVFLLMGFAWLGAFISGLLPYAALIHLARRLNLRSWAYFASGGAAAALLAFSVLLGADAYACGEHGDPVSKLHLALHLAVSGAAGGTACWYMLRRQARLDTRVRMS
jgi:hypothetical protein